MHLIKAASRYTRSAWRSAIRTAVHIEGSVEFLVPEVQSFGSSRIHHDDRSGQNISELSEFLEFRESQCTV